MENKCENGLNIFDSLPIKKLVVSNSIPVFINSIISVMLGLAGMFFLGMTHDDLQIAAMSIISPIVLLFIPLSFLFGIGAASVISRAMGQGDKEYAAKTYSFSFWGCAAVAVIVALLIFFNLDAILYGLGASTATFPYAKTAMLILLPIMPLYTMSNCCSNLLRSEGETSRTMAGLILGSIITIVLEPLFIVVLGLGLKGMVFATAIGYIFSAGYYFLYYARKKSMFGISPKNFVFQKDIITGVFSVGAAATLVNLFSSVILALSNAQLARFGDEYIAAYGAIANLLQIGRMGMCVGTSIQPMVGYYYGQNNRERLVSSIKFSCMFGSVATVVFTTLILGLSPFVLKLLLTGETAIQAAFTFEKILLGTALFYTMYFIIFNCIQAMGKAKLALGAILIIALVFFVPFVNILPGLIGVNGAIWASDVSDVGGLVICALALSRILKQNK